MKIVVLDGHALCAGDLSFDSLGSLGTLSVYDRTPPELVVERIGDADAVFTNKTLVSREYLASCPSVKFVGVLATGYNVVDLAAASERGIPVCNVPTYGTMAVAQFATALLLELCHQVGKHSDDARSGAWAKRADFCYWLNPLVELDVGDGQRHLATEKFPGLQEAARIELVEIDRMRQGFVLTHDSSPSRSRPAMSDSDS